MAKITKVLAPSEVRYKIMTGLKKLGTLCPRFGQEVTIIDADGQSFRKLAHRIQEGRIDGVGDLYRKYGPQAGDTMVVEARPGEPGVLHISFDRKSDSDDGPALRQESEVDLCDETSGSEFVLEKYLQEFMVSNFEAIFAKSLVLIDGQYATDVGLIDILARDPKADAIVVIELKKGREADKVVGQILRYMGWVKENVCRPGQAVRGIIVCKESDERLLYALKMVSGVAVKYYRVDFSLQDQP